MGTGAVGAEMITAIIDQPSDLTIVGARVYSDAKNGADIGSLVGRDPIGVTASSDPDAILALDADCVLYTPRNTSIDDVCAIPARLCRLRPRRRRDDEEESVAA